MVTLRFLFFTLLLCLLFSQLHAQDSLTFTPNTPLCVGEEVIMICYVEAPTSELFGSTNARISVNGSIPVSASALNTGIQGLDVSRYSADVMGLTVSTSRAGLRLVISDYLPSDSITTFQCVGQYPNDSFYYSLTPMSPMDPAVSPSPPVSLTADYNCSGTVQLAWTPGDSVRDIEMYFLYLNGDLIASLGPVTSYTHTTTLQRDTEYTYSIVAMSCAGNSTQTAATSISVGSYSLSDGSPPFYLSYNQSTSNLFIDWTLLPLSPSQSILIDYSLDLYYNHSQSDTTTQLYSYTSTFQQISTDTDYTVLLTPHSFNTDDGVVTNITVCLQITCGLEFSGVRMCAFFNSENPPTTAPPTIPTATVSTTPTTFSGAIIGIIVAVCCLLCGSALILTGVIIMIIVYVSKKDTNKRSDSQELEEPKKMEGLYADIDHTLTKPDTLKRPEPVEETLYSQVHAIDGPNQ